MLQKLCLIKAGLVHLNCFQENLKQLLEDLEELSRYASQQLHTLASREIMTFHDGFSYLASAFDLTIVHAIEEESGAEASAAELIDMIQIVSEHDLRAIFTERNGSNSAAKIIAAETNTPVYELDMVMAGNSYFEAMYHNIDTLKEALE